MKEPEQELEEALQELEGGKSVNEILKAHPEYSEEVRDLLTLSANIREIPHPLPREELLVKTLARIAQKGPRRTFWPALWKPAFAFATFVIVFFGVASISVGSVPGTMLYPIKVATERIRLTLAWTPEQKAEIRLELSDRRLHELLQQAADNKAIDTRLLARTLSEAQHALDAAAQLPESRRDYWMERMDHFANYQKEVFADLTERTPSTDLPKLEQARMMCLRRMEQIRSMGDMRGPRGPGMMQRQMMEKMMKRMMGPDATP